VEIIEDLAFKAELLKKIREREFAERTGVHQSDLVYCLNKQALRKLDPKGDTEHETLLFSLGWATQRWLTGQTEDEPEREVDGIGVTCDSLVDGVPWELKCTYQSNTKPIEENPHWIKQIEAQCYVTGSTTAYLSRLEIMGNWKWVYRPSKPETLARIIEEFGENWADHPTLHVYRLEFTQDELDRNWAWLKERKELYEAVLSTGKMLPKVIALPPGQTWECQFCNYQDCQER